MRIRKLTHFPTYGFREDGRIINLKTGNLVRKKRYLKLGDYKGNRININTEALFKELYPEVFGSPSKVKYIPKYNDQIEITDSDYKDLYKISDKGNKDNPIVINIRKVIIRLK